MLSTKVQKRGKGKKPQKVWDDDPAQKKKYHPSFFTIVLRHWKVTFHDFRQVHGFVLSAWLKVSYADPKLHLNYVKFVSVFTETSLLSTLLIAVSIFKGNSKIL